MANEASEAFAPAKSRAVEGHCTQASERDGQLRRVVSWIEEGLRSPRHRAVLSEDGLSGDGTDFPRAADALEVFRREIAFTWAESFSRLPAHCVREWPAEVGALLALSPILLTIFDFSAQSIISGLVNPGTANFRSASVSRPTQHDLEGRRTTQPVQPADAHHYLQSCQ
jgi:hypothetical protein